jgi:antitoxin component YwqK of YwqJK toxin-antitoxin module
VKKITVIIYFLFLITSAAAASEIICKRDVWSKTQKMVFFEDGKKIAEHTEECGGALTKKGNTINARVKFLDKINGPVHDKTYVYINYKNNTITDGLYKEYYLDGKYAGSWKSKNEKPSGLSEYFYRSGKLLQTARFKNGKVAGKLKRYYETGIIYAEDKYNKTNTAGELKRYYPDGKLREIIWVKDCKRAAAEYYDKNGKKLNFAARAAAAGAIPALIALFSLYLAGLAFLKLFSRVKPEANIISDADAEKAEIMPDKQVKKSWIVMSLFFSFIPWAGLMAFMAYSVNLFATGADDVFSVEKAMFAGAAAFVAVLLAWYFLINLDGKETVSFDNNVLRITGTWAGFKTVKIIHGADIFKIQPVVIEKESGEQYFGTSDIQQAVSPDSYTTYMSVALKNDEVITFAKYLGKSEMEKLTGFLKAKMPGIVSDGK